MPRTRCSLLLVASLTIISVCAFAATEIGHLVIPSHPQSAEIWLPLSGDAFLRQTFTVHLTAGANEPSFAFGKLGVPLDALDLEVLSPTEGVTASGITIAVDARDTVRWNLVARAACDATIAVAYPLKGIERRVEYAAILNQESETLDITAKMILTNKSKIEFEAAKLVLFSGEEMTTDLPHGETFELSLFTAADVPYRPLFIYDTRRYGGATAAVLRILRDRDNEFSTSAISGGKIRFMSRGAPGAYIGETTLPYLPPLETVEVKLGAVPEVSVTRKVVKSTQVDVKSDVRDKLVLFNQDDEIEFEIKNLRRSPILLYLRDKASGDWTMLRSSLPFEKTDSETIEFVLNMQPGETRKIIYTVRKHNLQP